MDKNGHVTAAEAVGKEDITGLGIPAQDTTYGPAVADGAAGLLTGADKSKLDGIAEGATKVEASATAGKVKVNGADITSLTSPPTRKSRRCSTKSSPPPPDLSKNRVGGMG